ncbi:MAG TPA: histidine phosphatase family protein [Candidatus Sulfotelmatobacter sp.]
MPKLPAAILIRHAETPENRPDQKLMKGTRDYPLDAKGKRESVALAAKIARFKPTVVLSSPMQRAMHPAAAIARKAGVALHVLPELAPQNFGKWTGKPAEKYEPKLKKLFLERPDEAPPGGESGRHFLETKVGPGYRKIKALIAMGERPAVVTHSRNLREMDYGLHDGPPADPTSGGPKPSGYALVDRNLKVKIHSAPATAA